MEFKPNKANLIVSLFLVFLAVVFIGTAAVILTTPTELTGRGAGNFSVNIKNGGHILEDGGFLFLNIPGRAGIYRADVLNMSDFTRISDRGVGELQRVGRSYYFLDEGGSVMRMDLEGEGMLQIIAGARTAQIVGGTVFYIDTANNLRKLSIARAEDTIVLEKYVREFVVYHRTVYYIDNRGDIRRAGLDGSRDELFIEANAGSMAIDGNHMFYINDGVLYSATLAGNERELVTTRITELYEYAIYGAYIIYRDKNGITHANINEIVREEGERRVIYQGAATALSIDENHFYFFTEGGKLIRLTHSGGGIEEFTLP